MLHQRNVELFSIRENLLKSSSKRALANHAETIYANQCND